MTEINKGLEGVIASQTKISSIIDDRLTYVGYDIGDLAAHASFEEVIYLLWYYRLPNKRELAIFQEQLTKEMKLGHKIIASLAVIAHEKVHPMSVMRTMVSMLGVYDKDSEGDSNLSNYSKAMKLVAKMPTLVAGYARMRNDEVPLQPRADLSLAGNFLYMLTGTEPTALHVKAMNRALVLHAEHEMNASTFSARVCVATLSDLYSGVTAAIGSLKGALHGGANEQVMVMLAEIGDESNVVTYLDAKLAKKEKIMGFGHRVYENGDPRAQYLRDMCEELTTVNGDTKWYDISRAVEQYVWDKKQLKPNVDFYSATVYHCLGIDQDLFTPIFTVSRIAGWSAHILEQYEDNRLIRPRAEYIGETNNTYIPVEER